MDIVKIFWSSRKTHKANLSTTTQVLTYLSTRTFSMVAEGDVLWYTIPTFSFATLKDVYDNLPECKDVDIDFCIQKLETNWHVIVLPADKAGYTYNQDTQLSEKQLKVKLTPRGYIALVDCFYEDEYIRLYKSRAEYILKWLPLFAVLLTMLITLKDCGGDKTKVLVYNINILTPKPIEVRKETQKEYPFALFLRAKNKPHAQVPFVF